MEHLGVLFVLKSSLLEMMLIDIIKTSTLIRTLKLGSRINYSGDIHFNTIHKKTMNEYRDLVICNNCLWTASLLEGSAGFKICPICINENLEVIPVEDYESYKMTI